MLVEELPEEAHRTPLPHLAKHPTNSLVHQVVGMLQVYLCIAQTPRGVTLLRRFP